MRVGAAGHHVVVAGAVIVLVVANRADDRQLVADGRQPRHVLGEEDSGDLRVDRLELAANFGRSVGLGIEGFEVARPAVQPESGCSSSWRLDAVAGNRPQPQGIDQAAPQQRPQPQLQAVARGRFLRSFDGWP